MNGYFNDPLEKTDQMFNFWNPAGIFRQKNPVVSNYGLPNLGCHKKMGPKSSQSLKSCWEINCPRVSRCGETSQDPELNLHLPLLLGPRAPKYHSVGVRLRLEIWCPWTPSLKLTASLPMKINGWKIKILWNQKGSECQLLAWLWGKSHQHEILGWWNTSGGLGGPSWKGDGHDFYHQR